MMATEAPVTLQHRFPDDIHDHEVHARLRIGATGEIGAGKVPSFTVRREDDYPVQYKGGSVRRETYPDGSFHIDADGQWDTTGKWVHITPPTFTQLLEDARKVLREGRIFCVAESTVSYTAGTDMHYSKTSTSYGPAWDVSFTRKAVRHQGEGNRPTLVFENPESFGAWAVDLDSYCGMWSARIALSCAYAAALHDAIEDATQRIALRAAGIPLR